MRGNHLAACEATQGINHKPYTYNKQSLSKSNHRMSSLSISAYERHMAGSQLKQLHMFGIRNIYHCGSMEFPGIAVDANKQATAIMT